MIGQVPNVEAGREFSTRRQAHEAGVHRPLQAGMCGTKRTGAESIVVSGGYKDDEDYGDVIVHTGHGGQDGAGAIVIEDDLTVIRGGQPTGISSTWSVSATTASAGASRQAPHGWLLPGRLWAVSGPSTDGPLRPTATTNDHGGPGTIRCRARRFPGYTHVSSHIRSRHRSSGIDVPVYSGQK
ncbi:MULTISPECIES: YDG/SRA domain-containing protein [Streptomyces]|uniref:YDG/SRA domain-containing protein n=3 Tax=Streptomyces TaxID=1883 RepID=UPI001F28AF41|nr:MULTISPECIES: YDG/SRA domain-containing protein [Streptomyces]